jgi:hypothetical protein
MYSLYPKTILAQISVSLFRNMLCGTALNAWSATDINFLFQETPHLEKEVPNVAHRLIS